MSEITTFYKDKKKTNAVYPITKTRAIFDDNNVNLEQRLNEALQLQMDLLWTNANPKSAFAPQTISLDLSSYKLIAISFTAHTGATSAGGDLHILEKNISNISVSQGSNSGIVDTRSFQRIIAKIDDNGVEFGNGIGSSATTESGVNMPYRIYGIK